MTSSVSFCGIGFIFSLEERFLGDVHLTSPEIEEESFVFSIQSGGCVK